MKSHPAVRKAAPMLARAAWGVSLAAWLAEIPLLLANEPYTDHGVSASIQVLEDSAFVLIAALALVILRSQPSNAVGWWIMVVGIAFPLEGLASELTGYGLRTWGETPLVLATSWVARWIFVPIGVVVPFILLLYPDGRPPTRRWRLASYLFCVYAVLGFGLFAFLPEPMEEFGGLANPLGSQAVYDAFGVLGPVFGVMFVLLPVVGASSLIPRYRNGDAVVRQQVKLIAWVAVVAVAYFGAQGFAPLTPWQESVSNFLFTVFVGGVITAGIARYRLFDVDRLISRTVTYGLVVVALALVFLGLVWLPSFLIGGFTAEGGGRAQPPSVLVAGSTLLAAVLFNPLRRRTQRWVDRHFNRSRYDAQEVMEEFSGDLSDRVDPDGVLDGFVEVVSETMQPADIGLWIKDREEPA